ncbi:MAG: hypothetical protein AB1767_13820, partial [Bacillota bacterium]
YKNIKILLITGYKETVNGQIDAAMPVMGIIEKPFDVMELLDQISLALSASGEAAERPAAYS